MSGRYEVSGAVTVLERAKSDKSNTIRFPPRANLRFKRGVKLHAHGLIYS